MSFQHFPGVGTVHLQTVTPARVVPGHERHKWGQNNRLVRTCANCGCVKTRQPPDYNEAYQMPGGPLLTERPACTGKPATPQPAQGQLAL